MEVAATVALVVTLGPILPGALMAAPGSADRVYTADEGVPTRDVIMVLGAKTDPGCPSGFLTTRLDITVGLFRPGRGKVILVIGANTAENNYETQMVGDYLISRGIPASRIMQDIAGYDTYDSCIQARDVFRAQEMTVVSQVYHLPRTIATCHILRVDTIGVNDVTVQQNWPGRHLQGELHELPARVRMQPGLLRGAKATQPPPSNAIQDTLQRS